MATSKIPNPLDYRGDMRHRCPQCGSRLTRELDISRGDFISCNTHGPVLSGRILATMSMSMDGERLLDTYFNAFHQALEEPLSWEDARDWAERSTTTHAGKQITEFVWRSGTGPVYLLSSKLIDDSHLQNILNYVARHYGYVAARDDQWRRIIDRYPALPRLLELAASRRSTITIPPEFVGASTEAIFLRAAQEDAVEATIDWTRNLTGAPEWGVGVDHGVAAQASKTKGEQAMNAPETKNATAELAMNGAVEGFKMGGAVLGQRATIAAGKAMVKRLGATDEQLALLETKLGQDILNLLTPLIIHGVATSAPGMIPNSKFVVACAEAAYKGNVVLITVDHGQAVFDFFKGFTKELAEMAKAGSMLLGQDLPQENEGLGSVAEATQVERPRRAARS